MFVPPGEGVRLIYQEGGLHRLHRPEQGRRGAVLRPQGLGHQLRQRREGGGFPGPLDGGHQDQMGRDIRRRERPGMEGEQDQGLRRRLRQDAMPGEDFPDRIRQGLPRHGFGPGLRVLQDQPLPLFRIFGRE